MDITEVIELELGKCFPFVLIVHIGTNEVNKAHIPESSQVCRAKKNLHMLFCNLKEYQCRYKFAVVFSACIKTKSPIVNLRIDTFNDQMSALCLSYGYRFIAHSNINEHLLVDQVHLGSAGQKVFVNNMKGYI